MAYAITNSSEWATAGDYPSDYQCLGLWLTESPEDDKYHQQDLYRQASGPNLTEEVLQSPDNNEHLDDAEGLCLHPLGSSSCRSHSSHGGSIKTLDSNGAGTMHSDCGFYPFANPQIANTQISAHMREEGKDSVSLPPAMEQYVHDHHRHELLALRHSNSSSTYSEKSKSYQGGTSNQGESDKKPSASRKSARAKRRGASNGGKHGRSG